MTHEHTVLIVDDEEPLADGYAAWLSDEYEVETAYSGAEALGKLDESVDVVLLDRRMPNLSGDEVLDEIRERGLSCRVGIISAVEPDFDIIDLGYDIYVEKPLTDPRELKSVVDKLLRRLKYDNQMQRFLTLASKVGTLETTKTQPELDGNDAYQRMRAELDEVRERLSSTTVQLDEDDLRVDFQGRNTAESELLDVWERRSGANETDATEE